MTNLRDFIDGIQDLDSDSRTIMEAIIEDDQFGARLDQECRPYHLRALRKKIPGLTITDVQKQIIEDALDIALSGTSGGGAGTSQDIKLGFDKVLATLEKMRQSDRMTKRLNRRLLLGQLKPVSSQSSKQHAEYRATAIRYYYGEDALKQSHLTCMLENTQIPVERMVAGHIYRQQWNTAFLNKSHMTVHDPRNIILISSAAKKRFDAFEWTINPGAPGTYKVIVLNPRLLQKGMEQYIRGNDGAGTKWSQVHNKTLTLPDAIGPARRVCGIHACAAISNAEGKGWIKEGEIEVSEEAYASDGCDKPLMSRFLRDASSSSMGGSSAPDIKSPESE